MSLEGGACCVTRRRTAVTLTKPPAGIEIAPDEVKAVRERLERDDLTVMAYRFEGDKFCMAQRFAAYKEALGDRFIGRVLPDSAATTDLAPFFDPMSRPRIVS